MLFENIKVGDRAEITLKNEDSVKKVYKSLVENKISDTELDISVPISYGRLVILNAGGGYQIMFFTDNGFFVFDMNIIKYFKDDGLHLMRIKLTSKGEKKQRREFFRYKCNLPIKYTVAPENPGVQNTALYDGMIIDLSGGGIMFSANERVHEGSMIKCAFMLENQLIAVNAKVLYKDDTDINGHKFQYRVQFVKILPTDQDRIIQYIFLQQRKELGKVY